MMNRLDGLRPSDVAVMPRVVHRASSWMKPVRVIDGATSAPLASGLQELECVVCWSVGWEEQFDEKFVEGDVER